MNFLSNASKPNRLGFVTSLKYELSNSDLIRGSVDFVTSDFYAMKEFMQELQSGELHPTFKKEFMCLYCASPNSIEHTHCKKCGAPRSFLIG